MNCSLGSDRLVAPVLGRVFITLSVVVCVWLVFSGAPAFAGGFKLASSCGSEGSVLGKFGTGSPTSVAVGVSGDVFVRDNGNRRVEVFNAECTEVLASLTATEPELPTEGAGLAVDDASGSSSEGDVYVVDNSAGIVDKFKPKGSSPGEGYEKVAQLSVASPTSVAVDSKGDVYVTGFAPTALHVFSPEGVELFEVNAVMAPDLTVPFGVAVDSAGNVYVRNVESNIVRLTLGPLGELLGESVFAIDESESRALAIDASGNVYVVANGTGGYRVAAYEPAGEAPGTLLEEFGTGEIGLSSGLATSMSNGDLYVADQERHQIHLFEGPKGAGEEKPEISGCTASPQTPVSAIVSCTVDPKATEATWYLQYGEAGSLTTQKTAEQTITSKQPISVTVEGLKANTTYRYVVFARNTNGTRQEGATFKTLPAVKSISTCTASGIGNESATLKALLEPAELKPGEGASTMWVFEYAPSNSNEFKLAPEHPTATKTTGTVEAKIEGLKPHQTYHCHLSATAEYNSTPYTEQGAEGQYTTTNPPLISQEAFSEVGVTTATVTAQINDEGVPGPGAKHEPTYTWEYGPCPQPHEPATCATAPYPSTTAPHNLKELNENQAAPATLESLEENRYYHLRVAATNIHGTSHGPEQTLHTYPASISGLPDNRFYEMVTPPENQNADADVPFIYFTSGSAGQQEGEPVNLPFQVSAGGSAVAYAGQATAAGSGTEGGGVGNEYLATRSATGGWVQQNVQPSGHTHPIYTVFLSDLSAGLLESNEPLTRGAPNRGAQAQYLRVSGSGSYHELAAGVSFAGATVDTGHVLLGSVGPKLEVKAREFSAGGLYDLVGGRLWAVDVLPDGALAQSGVFGGQAPGENAGEQWPDLDHVISTDGSRVFWTDTSTHDLYVRENDSQPQSPLGAGGECTVPADACTAQVDKAVGGGGQFWAASPDGREVIFTKGSLYEFDTVTGTTTDLTPGVEVAGVIGMDETGEDGSYVYYVDSADRLYLHHGGTARFIGLLSPADNGEGPPEEREGGGIPPFQTNNDGDWQPGLGHRTAEVAPDGRSVVFMSRSSLTGYDNVITEHATPRAPLRAVALSEVFVYDAESGRLSCVSCNPSGEPPVPAEVEASIDSEAAGFVPISYIDAYQPRWVSGDGGEVFFDSMLPLVPQDTNGKMDVYEWEREGSGSCPVSPGGTGGCVFLLSGGKSDTASWLIGASGNGGDVFIVSRARLAALDGNEDFNVFDVRAGGVPLSPPACTGAGCQGVPPAAPIFATPSSGTFNGVGNFSPGTEVSQERESSSKQPLTKAEKLARALKACRARPRRMRACEARARRLYGPKTRARVGSRGSRSRVARSRRARQGQSR